MVRSERWSDRWPRILALALLAGVIWMPACTPPSPAERFGKLYTKACEKLEAGRYESALELADRMKELGPESPSADWIVAEAYAGLGDYDAAFAALGRVEDDIAFADHLSGDAGLQPLQEDPRFEAFLERARLRAEEWDERMHTMHTRLDPGETEAFESINSILAAFEDKQDRRARQRLMMPARRSAETRWANIDEKIAALERYRTEHPDAAEDERAALEIVRAAADYKRYLEAWGGDSALVIEEADRFLDAFPESEDAAEVEFLRALATWKAYWGDNEEHDTLSARASEANRLLESLRERHPDSPEHDRAEVWQLEIAFDASGREVGSELVAWYDALRVKFDDDEELEDYTWENASKAVYQIEVDRSFDVRDLQGNRWNSESMRGKVVLIDFWATWCGPCIGEFPYLREAYEAYHDQGFEILGVSLDDSDRDDFEAECRELDLPWPQILDGGGWEGELVRQFRVDSVPTPILLDREGRVVALDREVRGDKLVDLVADLVGGDRPEK